METISQLLGGLGVLGIIGAIVLAGLLMFILPWWAIIECVQSNRSSNTKSMLVVLLIFTWGLGSLIYGLFVTGSRALRRFTLFAVFGPLLLLLPSIISFITGAGMSARINDEKQQIAARTLVEKFTPKGLSPEMIEPFKAIEFVEGEGRSGSATLAQFTFEGAEADDARDIDPRVRHIAYDHEQERCFALTAHDFGTITPSSGRFSRIQVDPSLGDFNWPKGLALNPRDGTVILMTSHVYTRFYVYDAQTSDWKKLPSEIRDLPLRGLTYSPTDNCLYALEDSSRAQSLDRIHRLSTLGAHLGSVELHPRIPLHSEGNQRVQLHWSSDKLLLLLPPFDGAEIGSAVATPVQTENRVFAVDPADGTVFFAEQ